MSLSPINHVKSMLHPDLGHIIEIQDSFQSLVKDKSTSPEAIASFLDHLDHPGRVAAVRALGPGCLKHLYEAVDGFKPITIDDVVPPAVGPKRQVRHFGKNSLPAFTIFEKRFLRPEKNANELWGYNFQTLSPITGPGYFVARNAPERGEVDIDYNYLPPDNPLDWPKIQSNEKGLSKLVYGYMIDRLRGVSAHVSIGRAWKKGKVQSAWFILCRDSDPSKASLL